MSLRITLNITTICAFVLLPNNHLQSCSVYNSIIFATTSCIIGPKTFQALGSCWHIYKLIIQVFTQIQFEITNEQNLQWINNKRLYPQKKYVKQYHISVYFIFFIASDYIWQINLSFLFIMVYIK